MLNSCKYLIYAFSTFSIWFSRWSAIAARLPGRTDNEIKNVWHTHLKKKLKNNLSSQDSKRQSSISIPKSSDTKQDLESSDSGKNIVSSPQQCSSEMSSVTDSSTEKMVVKKEEMDYSSEFFPQIDESFWSDELSKENPSTEINDNIILQFPLLESVEDSNIDDSMDFWYNLFIRAGDLPDLPEF